MTQLDDDAALAEELALGTAMSDAIKKASKYDPTWTARMLLTFAEILASNDPNPAARTIIAKEMLANAIKLDPHLISARWQ